MDEYDQNRSIVSCLLCHRTYSYQALVIHFTASDACTGGDQTQSYIRRHIR